MYIWCNKIRSKTFIVQNSIKAPITKTLNKQNIKIIVFYLCSTNWAWKKKSKHSSFDLNTVVYTVKKAPTLSSNLQQNIVKENKYCSVQRKTVPVGSQKYWPTAELNTLLEMRKRGAFLHNMKIRRRDMDCSLSKHRTPKD